MAAYFIAHYVVKDPKLYREYQMAGGPTMQAHGGEQRDHDDSCRVRQPLGGGPCLRSDHVRALRRRSALEVHRL